MTVDFKLPDLGEGIHEAEIIAVKVKEGDTIKEDQPILEVETDKAVVEIPSPYGGTIAKVHVTAGQLVTVGSVMVSYNLGSEKAAAPAQTAAQTAAAPAETASTQMAATSSRPAPAVVPAQLVAAGNGKNAVIERDRSRPVPATPATRRLARELGIDLYTVAGSGPAGRVLKEDIMAYAAGTLESRMQASTGPGQAPTAPVQTSMKDKFGGSETAGGGGPLRSGMGTAEAVDYPDFAKYGPVERLPLKSIRRKIAMNMTQAWTHIPHVTHYDEADVTALSAAIPKYEAEFAKRAGNPKVRPTLTVFALKAIASALEKYPQFNSSLDENTGEIVVKHYFNIGVAVATERGLIVPVIRDVDKKSFFDIAVELQEIAEKTRTGKIELERLSGGTFTLTNIGAIGGTSMSPMINFPEAAILGMARASQKPIVKDGQIAVGTILPLALSFDHRLADGAEAAYFVRHVVERLEDPIKFLLG
ncbi:MAG: dihydrolipoamide acetyltransferase family protein [Candidatus Obscuribacter sp.]|nr:2-oxo acid dehydrogenase subunit E2 [Candidatus Melainabacteria bacterium]MDX1985863.1 dihydrolipoamide acetyltransferase family protein [Candidatus Obscuribacter sp.]